MQTIITAFIAWIPLAFLLAIFIRPGWLNARAGRVGLAAEGLGWTALGSSVLATAAWLVSGLGSWSVTVTGAGAVGIRLDALSMVILCLVTFLGAVILRYSRNYLAGDSRQGYFFKWLLGTLGAVMSLCLSPGLVQFWLSWVACSVGLHHLLVYFPDRLGTLLSARKKFVVSRLGDVCLILAFAGIYQACGTQNFTGIFEAVAAQPGLIAGSAWIGWLIIGGAVLKSALFPFHTWLPDTMGTPTPVSALMHAGIINAGGYLVIRMSPLLMEFPTALAFLAVIGAITAAGGSMVMLTQTSVKRALAYSTIAQMGFMLLQCGLGAFPLAVLHLVAHSLYKAHAFLSSGSTVQSIKRIGAGEGQKLPSAIVFGLAGLSMAIVAALGWGLGLPMDNKPGMLVLGAVLVMALTQFLLSRLQQDRSPWGMGRGLGLGIAFVTLYLALAEGAGRFFVEELPITQSAGPMFQIVLACAMLAFLMLMVILPEARHWPSLLRLREALYVHALNGFYLNTLANRMARAMGLVPAGR